MVTPGVGCSKRCAPTEAPHRRSFPRLSPGATRGDHYHLRKVERFFVVKGTAEIALRRLYDDEVIRFRARRRRTGVRGHADDVGAQHQQCR